MPDEERERRTTMSFKRHFDLAVHISNKLGDGLSVEFEEDDTVGPMIVIDRRILVYMDPEAGDAEIAKWFAVDQVHHQDDPESPPSVDRVEIKRGLDGRNALRAAFYLWARRRFQERLENTIASFG
jgi:hypothetical protein